MKTILVTGGAGLIGSTFTNYYFHKHPDCKILVLDALTYAGDINNITSDVRTSDRFEFWYGDINNSDLVSDLVSRSDIIVHFAAETHVARSLYSHREFFTTDVMGTQAIANAVMKYYSHVERFIHISTSEVYGSALYEPMDENHPLNPTSPYAAAKTGADRLVYSYVQAHHIPAVIIRPFNNYGPRQHLEKVIPRFITSCILNEPLTIHGDGSAARDWLYVEDTVEGIDKAIEAPIESVKGQVFNLASERSLSILSIAQLIADEFEGSHHFEHMADRHGQVQLHIGSTEKAKTILGFSAKTPFEKGLKKTIDWYRSHQHVWKKQLAMKQVPVKMKDGSTAWY